MKIKLYKNSTIIRAVDRSVDGHYWDSYDADMVVNEFRVGDIGTLATSENVAQDSRITNVWLGDARGIGGNLDSTHRATSGWRGTTNDIAVYAHGLVEITDIRDLAQGYGYRVSFKKIRST